MTAGPTRQGTRGLTLREAAEVLGITKEAARKRVKRGSLRSAKGADGTVYVYLPAGGDAGTDAAGDVDVDDVRDGHHDGDLRDHLIAELRAEVEAWREESRRKDHIIAGLVERLPPQIEAPREARGSPTEGVEHAGGGDPHPATGGGQEGSQRSWWRRWFGFE